MSVFLLSHKCQQDVVHSYYTEIFREAEVSGIAVCLDVDGKGKGLVASREVQEGEVIFTECPLVCLQHHGHYGSALVCQMCLRFVGSVERQIGHKLQQIVDDSRGPDRCSNPVEERSDDDDESVIPNLNGALEMGERLEQIYFLVSPERIAALRSGDQTLPLTERFTLPASVPCRRGCGVLYCSAACESQAWEHSHCLLCTAPAVSRTRNATSSATATSSGSSGSGGAGAGSSSSAQHASTSAAAAPTFAAATAPSSTEGKSRFEDEHEEDVLGITVDRRALTAFIDHARCTNEIFLLAAQVVAATLLRAAKLLDGASGVQTPAAEAGAAGTMDRAASSVAAAYITGCCSDADGPSTSGGDSSDSGGSTATIRRLALLAAWKPYQYGWKRCWWECVAVPPDVDDEEEFRGQLKDLAADSLELLSAAIRDPRFAPDLLQLEVYGSIVGMFELNNLGLSVPTPVEDYFLVVDALEEGPEKEDVVKVTQPLLDALDSEYAASCEATAFLAIQSCINHSCDPNAAATCESGDYTIKVLAQRHIAAGEEVTLSYIDASMPYKQRQAELSDYGFVCRCARCVADAAAARVKKQKAAKKHKVAKGVGHRLR